MKTIVVTWLLLVVAIVANEETQYMDKILQGAASNAEELGIEMEETPASYSKEKNDVTVEVINFKVEGFGDLTTRKCKGHKPEIKCKVPLQSLEVTANARIKEGSGEFRNATLKLPIKEGELEVKVNTERKTAETSFSDDLKFDRFQFPGFVSDSKAKESISKSLDDKLADAVSSFLRQDYFNAISNAVMQMNDTMKM